MKEKRECKIVQDLLPNYIEKLTNEETNTYIKDHLNECNECQNILENMEKEFKVNSNKIDEREVTYIKKFSNKMKVLKFIILAFIIIYVLIVGRRTFVMASLSEKAEKNLLSDNYYAKIYSYQGDSLIITQSYNKGEDYLTTMTRLKNGSQIQKTTFYKKGNEELCLTEFKGKKYIGKTMIGGSVFPVTYVSDGILANLQYAFIIGIDKTYCNGKECYIIKGDSYERYVDKETGLAVRSIEKSNKELTKNDMVVDYEYEFDIVEDSDIVKPDTTGYIVYE